MAEGTCPSIRPMSEQRRELLPLLGVGGSAGNEVKPVFVELTFWRGGQTNKFTGVHCQALIKPMGGRAGQGVLVCQGHHDYRSNGLNNRYGSVGEKVQGWSPETLPRSESGERQNRPKLRS